MSQAEIVKSRIIDVMWAPGHATANGNGHTNDARAQQEVRTALARPQPEPPPTITTFAWANSPLSFVQDVELGAALDSRLVALSAPGSPQARSYRLLQHRLFAKGDPRVVAVTSAHPGEGKTTCAANLALVMCEEPLARVLLVDANLARPGLGKLFKFEPNDSFMCKLVRSEDAAPPYAVASLEGNSLQLAGLRPDVAQGKRLDRTLLNEAIRGLRSMFDYIVIDGPSVSESADANCIAQCADGVVVACRAGKSRKSTLSQAIDQLKPATVLGAVLLDAG